MLDREVPDGGTFIPICASDGSYEVEQCHKASGMVCWCVNRDSGEPIVGTTTRGITPNCSEAAIELITSSVVTKGQPLRSTLNTFKGG